MSGADRSDAGVPDSSLAAIRRVLLGLVLVSAAGLGVELLLLDHFESAWQWTPLALLAGVLAVTIVVVRRPSRAVVRLFQAWMLLCVAAGIVGIYLHYRGNVEFELEREPLRRGFALVWEAVRGATPALAPAALAQLGLLGLACTFRHPALAQHPLPTGPARPDGNPLESR